MTDADAELLSRIIGEIASELKCEPDNEAILSAISAQSAEIARLREALKPLADAAGSFSWIDKKRIDREGVYLWCESSNGGITKKISAGDAFKARAALETKG